MQLWLHFESVFSSGHMLKKWCRHWKGQEKNYRIVNQLQGLGKYFGLNNNQYMEKTMLKSLWQKHIVIAQSSFKRVKSLFNTLPTAPPISSPLLKLDWERHRKKIHIALWFSQSLIWLSKLWNILCQQHFALPPSALLPSFSLLVHKWSVG